MPIGIGRTAELFHINPSGTGDREYNGNMTRGYWFTSQANFTLTGAEVWAPTGFTKTWFTLLKLNAAPGNWPTTNTNYTTLYTSEETGSNTHTFTNSISVTAGDVLGILGLYEKSNGTKGIGYYGGTTTHFSIGGVSTEVKRFGHQGLLNATSFTGNVWQEPNYWYNRGKVVLQESTGITGTQAISALTSNTCSGGTITFGSSGTYSTSIDVGTGCTIDSTSKSGILTGIYSGSGNVTYTESQTAGKTTLNSINTYTGSSTVKNKAHLKIEGSIATSSGLTVESGGTISGSSFEVTNKTPTTTFTGGTFEAAASNTYAKSFISGSGGAIIDNKSYNPTMSGVFSGSGGLTFANSSSGGSSTLSGTNTYTGATTVGNGAHLKVTGSIANSSGLTVQSGGTLSGSALKTTSKLPTTTFTGGTLEIDSSDTYQKSFVSGSGGTNLDSNSYTTTLSGDISGSGGLTVANSGSGGSATLSGTNTYTGATTVGNGAHLKVTGSIANSSGLTVQSGGTLSGSALTTTSKLPTTTFTGGTLEIESSDTYQKSFVSGSGGTNLDSNSYTTTLSGDISGTGGLSISNSGSGGLINLSGANTYTGATTIGNGTHLKVNGSIASSSSLSVTSGSVISGTGYYPSTLLTTGATISPGNSIGTQNFNSLNLNGGSLDIEIQGPQNDKISVSGNVTNFTGTANIIPYGGGTLWPNFNYSIISAPNSSAFATSNSLTLNSSGVTSVILNRGATLTQENDGDPNTFDIKFSPNNGSGVTASALEDLGQPSSAAAVFDIAFNSLATQAENNANNTGSIIGNTGFTTGQIAAAGISEDFFTTLNNLLALSNDNDLVNSMNSMSPESYSAFQSVGLDTIKDRRDLLISNAGSCLAKGIVLNDNERNPLCFFTNSSNTVQEIDGEKGRSSYQSNRFSTHYGLEFLKSENLTLGAAFGHGTSNLNQMSINSSSVSSKIKGGAIYSVYKPSIGLQPSSPGKTKVIGLIGYNHFDIDGTRAAPPSGLIANPTNFSADYEANGVTAALQIEHIFTKVSNDGYLKPLIGIAYSQYDQQGFTESSSNPMNLKINSSNEERLLATFAIEVGSAKKPNDKRIASKVRLGLETEILNNANKTVSLDSSFEEASGLGSFTTKGQASGRDTAFVDGEVQIKISKNSILYTNASYTSFASGEDYSYGGGIRIAF